MIKNPVMKHLASFFIIAPPLFFGILIFFFTIFKILDWNNLFNLTYIISLLISIVIIFLTIYSFKNINFKIYFLIIFYSIIFSLYLFEFYLKYKIKIDSIPSQYSFYKNNSKLELFLENKELKPTIPPSTFLKNQTFIPLSGVSKSKTIFCNEEGNYSTYSSDRYGFNNPDNVWEGNQNKYILIGDSFVQGACVDRPYDIASQIRIIKPKKKIINLGYEGNGPLLGLATMKEYVPNNTKIIFFFFFAGNDLENLKYENFSKILNNYLNDINFDQDLKNKTSEVDIYLNKYIEESFSKNINNSLNTINFIKLFNTRNFLNELSDNYYLHINPSFKNVSIAMNEYAISKNAKFYFVYLPEINMYQKTYYTKSFLKYNKIKKIVKDLKINFIDIHEEVFLRENNPKILFNPGNHYNKLGYNKVALIISKYIE
jgi:hypothetical protein